MTSKPIRIAFVGCGRITGHHLRCVRKTPGLEIAAVCDTDESRARAYGEEFGVPYFTDFREMLSRQDVEVVTLATPSGLHFSHAMEILTDFRKPVIVEKPTFLRPSHVTAAFDKARSLGLKIFPVFQQRQHLAVRRVARGLTSGELGVVRLVSVQVHWCRPQSYYDQAPWRGTYAMDGGVLANHGIHHLDLLRHLGGEVAEVSAILKTLGSSIEVEDTAAGVLQFTSGAVGTVNLTTAARPDNFEASLTLVCERGLAKIGGIGANELQMYTPDPEARGEWSEDFSKNPYGWGHERVYAEIAADLRGESPFSIGPEDCLGTIRLLDAFYRAEEHRGRVAVDSPEESTRLGR